MTRKITITNEFPFIKTNRSTLGSTEVTHEPFLSFSFYPTDADEDGLNKICEFAKGINKGKDTQLHIELPLSQLLEFELGTYEYETKPGKTVVDADLKPHFDSIKASLAALVKKLDDIIYD